MKLDTPIGLFTVHIHPSNAEDQRRYQDLVHQIDRELARPKDQRDEHLVRTLKGQRSDMQIYEPRCLDRSILVTLHRGDHCRRQSATPTALGACIADSAVAAEITVKGGRPFQMDGIRAEALAKCMVRLGLNKAEREHLWRAYFALVHVIARLCIAVITTCPAGHRHRVEAVGSMVIEDTGKARVLFPSAREFCGWEMGQSPEGLFSRCEQPTIEAKDRYLYVVDLPVGRREKRRRAALARARATTAGVAINPDTSDDDVPF